MEGGFFDELRQLEFFPGAAEEKRASSCMPVVTSATAQFTPADLNQGIFQDEESVDFSALLEAYNTTNPTSDPSTGPVAGSISAVTATVTSSVPPAVASSNSGFQSFRSYLTSDLPLITHPAMYGSTEANAPGYHAPMQGANQVEMSPGSSALAATGSGGVDCIGVPATPSPHVVQIEGSVATAGTYTAMRPAPGKAQRSGKSKKQMLDKGSVEYRQKRDRNNVAVRKSREKSKIRVMDTEKRVKELEEENSHLQSKIALLTKELNVLKSLFTSAGVSQPPSLQVKEEGGSRK